MITLARVGDVVRFTFQDNPLYLNNGTIEVPVNSLSLLIDESNIATFKKAASNDIFLSCSLDELGMTRTQLINWYKDNMVDEGITPEEVEDIVESATTNLFGFAEYDSQNTRIIFKHDASGSVISSIDASDFVIDGMIDNVEIVTVEGVKYLKITFNTESGKEPILIPLADIFNPDNYYTKTATDALLAEKANTATTYTKTETNTLLAAKADTATTYTKTEVDNAISAATSGKADTSAVTEAIDAIDAAYKVADSAISGAVDSVSGDVATEVQRAISAETALDEKIDEKLDIADWDDAQELISKSLNDLNTRKLDASAYTPTDLSNYYTKSETDGEIEEAVSGKQDTLIAGTNITISGNVISAEGGGGKAIEGGRGISITTGETADTVSFNLPIYSGGTNSIKIGEDNGTLGGHYNLSVGIRNSITGENSIVVGADNVGNNTQYSAIFGYNNTLESSNHYCVVGGMFNKLTNSYETSFGNSSSSYRNSYSFGDSGNTLFSIGNGYNNFKRHNAFEIRQNGDIYIVDTNDTSISNYWEKPMIKLQDALGGGGSSYTAGDGIDITNDVISVTGKVDTSAITTSMTSSSTDSQVPSAKAVYDNFGGLKLVKLTQAEYDALVTKDSDTLYVVTDN